MWMAGDFHAVNSDSELTNRSELNSSSESNSPVTNNSAESEGAIK